MNIYHIMPIENAYFNVTTINMINDCKEKGFNHFFVVKNKDVYEQFKNKNSMIYEPNLTGKNKIQILNKYLDKSGYLFLHSNYLKTYDWIRIKNSHLKKIIWCVWGHDLYKRYAIDKSNIIKIARGIIKRIFSPFEKKKINKIFGIGIGFKYDAIEVRKLYKNAKILPFLYGYQRKALELNNEIFNADGSKKNDKCIKIMIGHSGYSFLNHYSILEKLQKFKNDNIIISLPLNYGNRDYIESVERYAKELYGNKVEIIKENLEYEEYIKYIKSVDICILDFKHQAALGNLWLLLKSGTKLFLNKDGIIKLAMNLEMIETYNTDQIDKMNFKEFSKPVSDKEKGIQFANEYIDEKTAINKFRILMNEIRNDMEVKYE